MCHSGESRNPVSGFVLRQAQDERIASGGKFIKTHKYEYRKPNVKNSRNNEKNQFPVLRYACWNALIKTIII